MSDIIDPRRHRYSAIYNPELIGKTLNVFIAGLGSIGAPLARTLAQAGASALSGADPDTVSSENLGPQGWEEGWDTPDEDNEPRAKTVALGVQCSRLNDRCHTNFWTGRAEDLNLSEYDCLCLCLDSLEARAAIYQKWVVDRVEAGKPPTLLIDGRMAALNYSVGTWENPRYSEYLETLPPPSAASPDPCNAKSTCFCAMECAGRMHLSIVRHLIGLKPIAWQGGNFETGLTLVSTSYPTPWLTKEAV